MKYYWKVVMNNGKEYLVENEISDGQKFTETIFNPDYKTTISCHTLKDGSSVVISSQFVSSIEFNFKM